VLPAAVNAFHAQAKVAIYATIAISILFGCSLDAPFPMLRLGGGHVCFQHWRRIPGPSAVLSRVIPCLDPSAYELDGYRRRVTMPCLVSASGALTKDSEFLLRDVPVECSHRCIRIYTLFYSMENLWNVMLSTMKQEPEEKSTLEHISSYFDASAPIQAQL